MRRLRLLGLLLPIVTIEGRYDRQFAASELFDLVTSYEERIAGRPGGS